MLPYSHIYDLSSACKPKFTATNCQLILIALTLKHCVYPDMLSLRAIFVVVAIFVGLFVEHLLKTLLLHKVIAFNSFPLILCAFVILTGCDSKRSRIDMIFIFIDADDTTEWKCTKSGWFA